MQCTIATPESLHVLVITVSGNDNVDIVLAGTSNTAEIRRRKSRLERSQFFSFRISPRRMRASKAKEGARKNRQNYNKMNRMRKFEIKNGTEFLFSVFLDIFLPFFLWCALHSFFFFSFRCGIRLLRYSFYLWISFRLLFSVVVSRARFLLYVSLSKFLHSTIHSLQWWRNGIMGKAFSWTLPTITQS